MYKLRKRSAAPFPGVCGTPLKRPKLTAGVVPSVTEAVQMLQTERGEDRVLIAPELNDFVKKREFKTSPKKTS